MKRNKCFAYVVAALTLNSLILLYFVILQHEDLNISGTANTGIKKLKKIQAIHKLTIIVREYEEFENNLKETIDKVLSLPDNVNMIVIGDKMLYPPVKHETSSRIKIISLEPNLLTPIKDSRPENFIQSDFVLFLPDSFAVPSYVDILTAIEDLSNAASSYNTLAIPMSNAQLTCQNAMFNVKKWTLVYLDSESQNECDIILGNHGILTKSETILSFTSPFIRPVYLSFYIQNMLIQGKVRIYDKMRLNSIKELFQEPHIRWKHKKYEDTRRQEMFRRLGIKLVKHGENRKEEWFGCSKHSTRCFDTVVNDMPEYLYQGRWTPPCCLKALKETVHHVFNILTECGARFWLEGGSLLGAARNKDIIPWDYDVDIGIYRDDLIKCQQLKIDFKNSLLDEDGFLWEKAVEGEFYRVQYSESNRLHVDIFPFYSKNGTMTKNTWMKTHRQDTEFPERFLKPLTKIKFVGIDAPAPNNVKEFLEFKFGKGVIDNPKYPNSQNPNNS